MLSASAFSGATDFALDSAVTDFVLAKLRDMLSASAFSGATDFALQSALTNQTAASPWATMSSVTPLMTAAVSPYATNAESRSYSDSAVSPYPTTAQSRSYTDSAVSPYSTTAQSRSYSDSSVTPYSTTTQSRAYADSTVTPYAIDSKLNGQLGPGAVSSVSMYATPALATEISGTSIYFVSGSVSMPHLLTDPGATPFSILPVLASQFPSGVTVVEMGAEVTSGNTTYQLEFQVWSGRSFESVLGRANCTNGVSNYITGVTEVAQNKDIFVSPPTTAAHMIRFWMRFLRR
jgi:hypothetical protein